jgi:hypothetical protein
VKNKDASFTSPHMVWPFGVIFGVKNKDASFRNFYIFGLVMDRAIRFNVAKGFHNLA